MVILDQKFRDPWYICCSPAEYLVWFHYKGMGCDSWLCDKYKILFFSKLLSLAAKHSMDVENGNHVRSMVLPCVPLWSASWKWDGFRSAVNQRLQLCKFTVQRWFTSHKCSATRLLSSPQSFLLPKVILKCSSYL